MFLFRRYSLSPERNILLVIVTSVYSVGSIPLLLCIVRETSAIPMGFLEVVPLKITFSILSLLKAPLLCSPRTHLIESTILVLPQPFGPTIEVTPSLKFTLVFCAKDLNPSISSLDKYTLRLAVKLCNY